MKLSSDDIRASIERAEFRVVRVADIVPWEENPRDNIDASERLIEAMEEVGYGAPVVLQKSSMRCVAGHTRRLALLKLGIDVAPAYLVDVDDETASKMALADNRAGEFAKWRMEPLAALLAKFTPDVQARIGWRPPELNMLRRDIECARFKASYVQDGLTGDAGPSAITNSNRKRRLHVPGKPVDPPLPSCKRCPIGKAHAKGGEADVPIERLRATMTPPAPEKRAPREMRGVWFKLASWAQ